MGFILGPLLGGLLGDLDPRAPFVAAAILAGLNFTFGWFVLPESLPKERRRAFDWRRANPAGGLMKIGELPGVGPLLVVMLAYQISNFVYPAVWAYWTQTAFGWDARLVGASLAAYGVAMAVVQAGLIRAILPRLGEVRAVCWGLVLNTVCLVIYGLISEGWMIWVMIPISAVGAIVAPAMQGVMSRAAGADQQGELQGVLASISALSMVSFAADDDAGLLLGHARGRAGLAARCAVPLVGGSDGDGAGDLPRHRPIPQGHGHPGGVGSHPSASTSAKSARSTFPPEIVAITGPSSSSSPSSSP